MLINITELVYSLEKNLHLKGFVIPGGKYCYRQNLISVNRLPEEQNAELFRYPGQKILLPNCLVM
jgi:hypothetical protein